MKLSNRHLVMSIKAVSRMVVDALGTTHGVTFNRHSELQFKGDHGVLSALAKYTSTRYLLSAMRAAFINCVNVAGAVNQPGGMPIPWKIEPEPARKYGRITPNCISTQLSVCPHENSVRSWQPKAQKQNGTPTLIPRQG
jgi:hypothetical protein